MGSEQESNNPENGLQLSSILGFVLLKPDCIERGVAEFVIDRYQQEAFKSADYELAGVDFIEPMSEEQVRRMYPTLADIYMSATIENYTQNSTVLLTFVGNRPGLDIWENSRE